jgi:hypothetical protein
MMLKKNWRDVGPLVEESDHLDLGFGAVNDDDFIGEENPHAAWVDESALVLANGSVLRGFSQGAHALGVIKPGFGDAVVYGVSCLVGRFESVILDVAAESSLANHEFGMLPAPMFLKTLYRETFFAPEKSEEFDHGLSALRAVKPEGAIGRDPIGLAVPRPARKGASVDNLGVARHPFGFVAGEPERCPSDV